MAIGDVVSDIATVLTGANFDFQPAAGVEIMILEVGSDTFFGSAQDRAPDIGLKLFDGTIASQFRNGNSPQIWSPLKLCITNAIRLRVTNNNASTANLSYAGIQINA